MLYGVTAFKDQETKNLFVGFVMEMDKNEAVQEIKAKLSDLTVKPIHRLLKAQLKMEIFPLTAGWKSEDPHLNFKGQLSPAE